MKKTAKYYNSAAGRESYKKKLAYQKEYNRRPEERKRRSELNKINRKSQAAGRTKKYDGKDASHTKSGIKFKPQSVNRGSKKDRPGDIRARGNKR